MKLAHLLAAAVAAAMLGSAAHAADLVQTYDFSGTLAKPLAGNDQVTGSFTLDLTKSTIGAFDFSTPFGTLDGDGGLWVALHPAGSSNTLADLTFIGGSGSLAGLDLLFFEPFVDGESLTDSIETSKRPPVFLSSLGACGSFTGGCGGRDLFLQPFSGGVLSLASVASAVPEPAAWISMILGLFGLGWMLRKRPHRERLASPVA